MDSATRSGTYQVSGRDEEASSQPADQVEDGSSAAPPAKRTKLTGLRLNLSDPFQSGKQFYIAQLCILTAFSIVIASCCSQFSQRLYGKP
ncbi:TPA: hypothetical protein ACH3X1_010121 [Trebouxia sp. C0004]